jgi:hypothetical protein
VHKGTYKLRSVAYDPAKAKGSSPPITVTVSN